MIVNKEEVSIAQKLLNDHHVLMEYICGVREWIVDVSEWGMPRFGELGTRLLPFRETLAMHFADEESQGYVGMDSEHAPSADEAAKNEWPKLHHDFLKQLDALIQRLKATEPEFSTWQDAVRQVESVITEICDHEQQEIQFLQSSLSQTH